MNFKIKNNIIMFILILLIIIGHVYAISFEPYDELWNFQNIYKLYSGNTIYSDANIIVTPFFYFIALIFFKIFGISIINFRYFNVCIIILFFSLLYQLFKLLKVSKHINYLFLALIFVQIFSVINGGANYNILCNTFVLLGIYCYIKFSNKKYFDFLHGFIIFLIFFTKQNIGIYYACSIIIFEFIYKSNLINFLLKLLKKCSTFFISLLITFIIFFKNNILSDFINCTFGGILDFGSSNIEFSASPHIVVIMAIILFLYFYIIFSKKTFNENIITPERRKNLHLIGMISIGISLSIFPIANTAHLLYIFPFFAIILFYFLDFALLEEIFDTTEKIKKSYIITALILFFMVIRIFSTYLIESKTYIRVSDINNPFYQARISASNFDKMNTMVNYINNKHNAKKSVVIIAFDSALSMVPLNQNNKHFDLVFNGNLGYNGEQALIEEIKKSTNTEFLIHTNENDCYWQESKIIRNFIIQNLKKSGEILNYSIYELPQN